MKKKINLLAVDDIPSNLIALQAVFSGSNYNIIEATSGEQAISILRERHDIAVVLLDVQMPTMDGFETAMIIKKMDNVKDIPIIFITAVFNEDPFVKKGYESGAIDYFSKPFDPEILRMKVDMYSSFKQKAFLLKEREIRIQETEELLKVGKKLSGIFESLTVGVLVADPTGVIFQTNDVVSRIFKTAQFEEKGFYGEILGWWDTNGSLLKNENGPLWLALNVGQSTHNQKTKIKCLDGSLKNILASASPLLGLDKKIVGAVVVVQDITETQKIEEAFEERISQLISLSVELDRSLA